MFMTDTLKQIKEIAKLYQGQQSAEEIAVEYQSTRDGVLLAEAFTRNVGIMFQLSAKYDGILTTEDIMSFSLEEMDKVLNDFDETRRNKVSTVFRTYFSRRLYAEANAVNYHKNKANLFTQSFDAPITGNDELSWAETSDITQGESMVADDSSFSKIELLESLRQEKELTENEFKYCEIILNVSSDPKNIRDTDIAETLSVSSAAINYIKKSLQKKLYGFNKILSVEV